MWDRRKFQAVARFSATGSLFSSVLVSRFLVLCAIAPPASMSWMQLRYLPQDSADLAGK
ncbi:MAG: hypothetical protein BWX47_00618 [candidate division Hyd24-12 bacterium ADurb.Bin004]|nr:MAG: hypothetical protein BWX47_00618 [candidate division Hyd24-12 bacterium ADurb.Bin004]